MCGSASATSTLAPAGRRMHRRTIEAIRTPAAPSLAAHPLSLERRIDLDPVWGLPPWRRLGEPHLASGTGPARPLPGRHQRMRDLLPLRRLHDCVEGRPARRQPLRDRPPRRRLAGSAPRGRPPLSLGRCPGDRDPRGVAGGRGAPDDRPHRPRRDGRHRWRLAAGRRRGRRRADRRHRARTSARTRARWSTRRGCWSCPAWSTSTPTPGWRPTRSRTASTAIRWPPPSVARPRSWPSTTLAPAPRERPAGPSWRGCATGGRGPRATRRWTTRSASS